VESPGLIASSEFCPHPANAMMTISAETSPLERGIFRASGEANLSSAIILCGTIMTYHAA